jgi:WD40 repeat protein
MMPGGKLVAVASHQRIYLVDTTTGREVKRFETPDRIGSRGLVVSPDGKRLAIVGFNGCQVYDAVTGNALGLFKPPGRMHSGSAVFSTDGKKMAVGGDGLGEKTPAVVWDVDGNKQIAEVPVVHDMRVGTALSADGKVLATWGHNIHDRGADLPSLQLWDVATGKETGRLKLESSLVLGAVFTPDGKHILVSGQSGALSVWDVATVRQVRRFAPHSGTGGLLAYSPDGKVIAAATADGVVQLWETATGKRLTVTRGPHCSMVGLTFRPDNTVLALGLSDQALCLWEAPSGRVLTPLQGHTGPVSTIAFRCGGKEVVTGGPDGLRTWDTAGKPLRHLTVAVEDPYRRRRSSFLLASDGRHALALGDYGGPAPVIEVASGEEVCALPVWSRVSASLDVSPAALTSDWCLSLAKGGRNRETVASLWQVSTGEEVRTFKGPPGDGHVPALSPDGKSVALASHTLARGTAAELSEVRLWETAGGKEAGRTLVGVEGWVAAMTFSADGAVLAAASSKGFLRLWDVAAGAPLRDLEGNRCDVAALAFAPDGRTLAAAFHGSEEPRMESRLVLWELVSGRVRTELKGHNSSVLSMAFSLDGRLLATGGADSTVLLWDVTCGTGGDIPRGRPTAAELAALWGDLDSTDAGKAHRAMARLTLTPAEALDLFQKELKPAEGKPLPDKVVERLIAELDDESFEVREKATRALEQAGRTVRGALFKALEAGATAEKKRRLQGLLDGMASLAPPELIRPTRALEVLERLGTPEAGRLLEALARGNPAARLTTDAADTLRRLRRLP